MASKRPKGSPGPSSSPSSPSPSGPVTAAGPLQQQQNQHPLKEKIVQMYEVLLFSGVSGRKGSEEESFWNEFFLLKPKVGQLEALVERAHAAVVSGAVEGRQLTSSLSRLFAECLANLERPDRPIRTVYALQTLCGLFRSTFSPSSASSSSSGGFISSGSSIIGEGGLEEAEVRMQGLVHHLNSFLTGPHYPASLKDLCLNLVLIVATAFNNVSANILLEYLMANSLFESLIHLLSHSDSRAQHGHSAVLILTLLVQYRKYETANPYVVKLSILDQEIALHGYSQVITASLSSFTSNHEAAMQERSSASSGWLTSITSMVGSMFVPDDGSSSIPVEQMRANNAVLLALYEAIHLNRNFIATLAQYQADPVLLPNINGSGVALDSTGSTDGTAGGRTTGPEVYRTSGRGDSSMDNNNRAAEYGSELQVSDAGLISAPSNLLVTFLEYCSIVMQDIKSESSLNTVKLSFLILVCITEDQYANALINDHNLVFKVKLYRAPMRHRKPQTHWDLTNSALSRPLACSVLDLMVEFIRSHMMKKFPIELYTLALGVVQRLLSFQKRSRVRLLYPWKELWTALISLVKFLTSNESSLVKKMNIFAVNYQITVIFNLFITYGDTFLPSPSSYDELYYELVRCRNVFDLLYSMALRYSTGGGEYKDQAVRVTNSLVNVRAITAHFSPKIDAWLAQQQLSTPSEDQILEVVKANYDSLTLKLQDGLDQYERYSEVPHHSQFFTTLVRSVVSDTRQRVVLNDLELHTVLHDFSTIQ